MARKRKPQPPARPGTASQPPAAVVEMEEGDVDAATLTWESWAEYAWELWEPDVRQLIKQREGALKVRAQEAQTRLMRAWLNVAEAEMQFQDAVYASEDVGNHWATRLREAARAGAASVREEVVDHPELSLTYQITDPAVRGASNF